MGRRVATKARRRASPRHRCSWATREPLLTYHDIEWGTPLHDDRLLFEFLILEGMQAGLSWETVLRKRDAFRRAFARFDPIKVAQFTSKDVARLMKDETIIRNRAKIEAAIGNAQALLVLRNEFGSFDSYAWKFDEKNLLSKDLPKDAGKSSQTPTRSCKPWGSGTITNGRATGGLSSPGAGRRRPRGRGSRPQARAP